MPEAAEQTVLVENGDLRLARCRYGLMLYNIKDYYIGGSLDAYREYCEDEALLYRTVVEPGQLVIEAGANIGCHTLVLAAAVGAEGRVLAFEPQRVVYQMLCANLALNDIRNVIALQGGAGAERAKMRVPPVDYGQSGNFGDVSLHDAGPGEDVEVRPIDSFGLSRCDLIKVDVQGMEKEVLTGADKTIAKFRPILYVENDLKEKSSELIQHLFELDYRPYWHRPRLFHPENFAGRSDDIFGSVINVNMLCVPKDRNQQVTLREVTSTGDWWQDDRPAE